jgi:hypothetical protein
MKFWKVAFKLIFVLSLCQVLPKEISANTEKLQKDIDFDIRSYKESVGLYQVLPVDNDHNIKIYLEKNSSDLGA